MTQEQLKEQFIEFANNNLNNSTKLDAIVELLKDISIQLYNDGFTSISNRVTTAELTLKEITE